MKYFNQLSLIAILSVLLISSCKKDDDNNEVQEVIEVGSSGVLLEVGNDKDAYYPLHYIENAEEGQADIVDASEIPDSEGVIMLFMKDGYAYVNDYTGETFKKIKIAEDGTLTVAGSVPTLGVSSLPLFTFLDEDRLLLSSTQSYAGDGVISYQIINISSMTEDGTGTFTLPLQGTAGNADFSYEQADSYVNFEGKIYIPFVEAYDNESAIYEQAYVAVYDATTLEYEKVISSDKTASLMSGWNPGSAISESGDLYIASSNTNQWNGNESVPSGIVRINSGETEFDNDYFLDITAATGLHSLGMVYAGNNKAVVQIFNGDLIEYHVADLSTKSVTKLEIPEGDYPVRRSFTLLENGNVAIISNNATENALYIYNSESGAVTKGLIYDGTEAIFSVIASN
jgi:hypothetical protein